MLCSTNFDKKAPLLALPRGSGLKGEEDVVCQITNPQEEVGGELYGPAHFLESVLFGVCATVATGGVGFWPLWPPCAVIGTGPGRGGSEILAVMRHTHALQGTHSVFLSLLE